MLTMNDYLYCFWNEGMQMMLVRDVDTTAQMMTTMTMVTMMTTMMTTMSDLVRLVWGIAALNRPLSAISRCKKIIIIAVIQFYLCVTITIIIVISIKQLSSWSPWQQWSPSSPPLPTVIDEKGNLGGNCLNSSVATIPAKHILDENLFVWTRDKTTNSGQA